MTSGQPRFPVFLYFPSDVYIFPTAVSRHGKIRPKESRKTNLGTFPLDIFNHSEVSPKDQRVRKSKDSGNSNSLLRSVSTAGHLSFGFSIYESLVVVENPNERRMTVLTERSEKQNPSGGKDRSPSILGSPMGLNLHYSEPI